MNSAVYGGWVRHRRREPRPHEFSYRLCQLYLDLGELDQVFRGRPLWSARRPAPAWFRRGDHLGDPGVPLDEAARDLVETETGRRPAGPIRLLTHPRYFGYVMNPVSFYYCFDARDERVDTVVAEIHNTPWGERHCYVLPREASLDGDGRSFRFAKRFHVSPYMPMEQTYLWRFSEPGDELRVSMENIEGGRSIFDAALRLRRREISSASLAEALTRYPFMTLRVAAAIYFQALRLKLKNVPFHPHPKHRENATARTP